MILRVIIALVVVAGLAFAFQQFRSEPGDAGGEALVSVTVPELSAAAKMGGGLFNANCASCHGQNAEGKNGFGPPLIHKIYKPSHHGDMAFVLAVKQGVRSHHWNFGNMAPVANVTDEEVLKIIEYVRVLQRANGIN